MQKRSLSFTFIFFVILSVLIFFIAKTGVLSGPANIAGVIVSPLQRLVSSATPAQTSLENQNKILAKKLVDYQKLVAENSALRDQFAVSYPKSQDLLPAAVVAAPGFIPAVSTPEYLIINKGSSDGIKVGMAVVVKDNLVGKISTVTDNLSKVTLVSNPEMNFSAITEPTRSDNKVGALGLIKGDGGQDMILDNILLSETISVGDYIATKGDLNIDNTGFPPSLIVGKVVSVDKKASELFQRAKVKSLLDFSKLTTIFVVIKSE